MSTATFPTGTILGYPRIGRRRELKKAVEAFWAGTITAEQLEATAAELRAVTRERLAGLGLGKTDSSIPETFSYYDQVLDAAVTVGAVPTRFERLVKADGTIDLAGYFTIARGEGQDTPAEMTKWFDSNYHYLVPEIGPETNLHLASDRLVREVAEATTSGYRTRPVIVGPVTLLLLSKPSESAPAGYQPLDRLDDLLPVYAELLAALTAVGAEWVQLDEPALVSESIEVPRDVVLAATKKAYDLLSAVPARPQIFVAAPYGSLDDALPVLLDTPIEAVGLDLVKGDLPSGIATDKVLVGGVIDGHNIWRGDLEAAFASLESLKGLSPNVAVSSSTSLFHVPHDVQDEPLLADQLKSWLAFADQKVGQVATLAKGLAEGKDAIRADLDAASAALEDRHHAAGVRDGAVRARAEALAPSDFNRGDYATRLAAQDAALHLPFLPTTTIGSFPQTGDIRKERAAFAKGAITEDAYKQAMRDEIKRVVDLQEEIGLDVLVHGEP
ncbi:MAG: 5-methyltetrahydropteroyltriglutamate--homocysteine S-methyltransferase, partial [Rhodoglobus sp.]